MPLGVNYLDSISNLYEKRKAETLKPDYLDFPPHMLVMKCEVNEDGKEVWSGGETKPTIYHNMFYPSGECDHPNCPKSKDRNSTVLPASGA